MAEGNHYDYLFKILLAGDSGVGKSNLVSRFTRDEFNIDTRSTIGIEFATRTTMVDDQRIKAQIWDPAGQCLYRTISAEYYRGALGALLMYDVTKPSSFSNLKAWVEELHKHASPHIVVILIGNKTDLESLRLVPAEAAETFATENGMMYVETSAFNSSNVEFALESVLTQIYHMETGKHIEPSSSPSGRHFDI